MPSREEHLHAADENAQIALDLLSNALAVSWSPVLAFYSALHLVDAYFADRDLHPQSHTARRARMERDSALDPVYSDYRLLETLSRNARYDLRRFTVEEAQGLIDGQLGRITARLRSLRLPGGNP